MKNITYINAGAGTGKTYNLTDTLCSHLQNNECQVSEIIMTTFTEMAAADLRKEARKKLLEKGLPRYAAQLENAKIGTVHSIALKYIQRYWYKLGLSASVTVIDDDQKNYYINSTLSTAATEDDIRLFTDYAITFKLQQQKSSKTNYGFWKDALKAMIEKATAFDIPDMTDSKEKSLTLAGTLFGTRGHIAFVNQDRREEDIRSMYYECIERLFNIYQRWCDNYMQYKQQHNAIEFNDMENMFLRLLDDDEVKQDIRTSVKYVFVDEFQDSNPKQIRIFDRLSELVNHSYWVGDPKQAIYGFRACDITLVQAVMKHITDRIGSDGFDYKNLDTSYRSVKALVDNTNAVFVPIFTGIMHVAINNVDRQDTMPTPSLLHWDARVENVDDKGKKNITCNAPQAYNAIAAKIKKMLNKSATPNQVYDKQSKALRDIRPSDIAILAFTNTHVKDIAAALRKYHIPVATEDTVKSDYAEISLVSLLLNYLIHSDAKLLKAELSHLYRDVPTKDILDGVLADISDLDNIKQELLELPVASIVRQLILRLDLIHLCGKWGNAAERQQHLTAMIANAEQYDQRCLQSGEAASIDGYLSVLNDGFHVGNFFCKDGVNVMTYHKSKGLQWPVVILYSLDSGDNITEKGLAKSYTNGITALRKTEPTADEFYTDYYLLCMPSYLPGRTNIMDYNLDNLRNDAAFVEYSRLQREEKQRLIYVGATRARDYMITISKKGTKLGLLENIGIKTSLVKDKESQAFSSPQSIWGEGTQGIDVEIIMPEEPDAVEEPKYSVLKKNEQQWTERPKYLQPSMVHSKDLVDRVSVNVLHPANGQQAPRIITPNVKEDYDVMGTCIHNFMAVYDPQQSNANNVAMAKRVVTAFHLEDVLPHEDIVYAAEILFSWLEQQYGEPCKVLHEVPFRQVIDHQIVNGEIDMLWYTAENECVLVDFKSYPGAISALTDKENSDQKDTQYAGKHAPQLSLYKSVLTNNGINVKSVLLYYPILGCVVELTNL